MQGGCPIPPTKPKGRPKKNSIPSMGMLDTTFLTGNSTGINALTNGKMHVLTAAFSQSF